MVATAALLLTTFLALAPQNPPAAEQPHVEWQRTLADALAVQKATGLPLLIAVNMDGEVFNDRFASSTYRDAAFLESTRGYVCVVASPDRHTERDYDAFGNRIECPRFPGCTCAEHIAIEPELFARWFNGTRNAPRHVGVSPAGKVLFDRFLDASMETAIAAIEKHRGRPKAGAATPPDDLSELFTRRDAASRRSLERRWRQGDFAERRKLLELAAQASNEPVDLLRAALRSDDPTLFALAALATGKHAGPETVVDLEDALARVSEPELEQALVARLGELGKTDQAAARLASHFTASRSAPVGKPWGNPWAEPRFAADDRSSIESELDRCEAALRTNGSDPALRLQLAIAQLALAQLLYRDGAKGVDLWFGDALQNGRKVGDPKLFAEAQAVVAWAAYMLGDRDASSKAIVLAQSLVNSPQQPDPFLAARFLELIVLALPTAAYADPAAARGRSQRAEIERALATMDLLLARQAASEQALLAGIGLLEFGGLRAMANKRLEDAAAMFPASAAVHERWRARLIADHGCDGMQKAYARHVAAAKDLPTAEWFAAFAALVAGEQHTKDQRDKDASSAYGEAIERFAKAASGNADFADSANHFTVLALGGRAELLLARGQAEAAAADLLRAAELRPASLDESDGLQRKPRAIAGRIARALEQAGKAELAAKLKPILP